MSAREAAARETLARLGVDVAALPAADALAAAAAGPDGPALAAALAEFPTPAVAALLIALEARTTDRAARKALRLALYRLRQRGVAVPEPAAPAAPPAPVEPEVEGLISALGGDGDRLIWLVKPLAEGGSLVVYAHVHEPRGLLELSAAEVGRKKLRTIRHELRSHASLRLVPVDWRVADALLVEAHERAGSAEAERSYLRVRPRITTDPPLPPREPVSTRVATPVGDEAAALVAGSAALLAEPEFRTWFPSLEATRPFVEEIAGTRESPIILSPTAQADRTREIVARAARTLAPPAVLARRLEGAAYVLAEAGREAPARQALAVAAALRTREKDAADVPFAAAFVQQALGELAAADAERRAEAERSALVVTPGQYLRDRSSSRPTRTRG